MELRHVLLALLMIVSAVKAAEQGHGAEVYLYGHHFENVTSEDLMIEKGEVFLCGIRVYPYSHTQQSRMGREEIKVDKEVIEASHVISEEHRLQNQLFEDGNDCAFVMEKIREFLLAQSSVKTVRVLDHSVEVSWVHENLCPVTILVHKDNSEHDDEVDPAEAKYHRFERDLNRGNLIIYSEGYFHSSPSSRADVIRKEIEEALNGTWKAGSLPRRIVEELRNPLEIEEGLTSRPR